MASPLAELFIQLSARGGPELEAALREAVSELNKAKTNAEQVEKASVKAADRAEKEFEKAAEAVREYADELEDADNQLEEHQRTLNQTQRQGTGRGSWVDRLNDKLKDASASSTALLGRLGALAAAAAGTAVVFFKLGNTLFGLREMFRDGAEDVEAYKKSLSGREDVSEQFTKVRDRIEEISQLLLKNQTSFGTLIDSRRSRTSLQQEKRALENELKQLEQLNVGQRNRQRRAEREAAEERQKEQDARDAEQAAKEAARAAEQDEKDRQRLEEQTKRELEAAELVARREEELAARNHERELERIREQRDAQLEASARIISALNQLGGNLATTNNQLLRKLDELIRANKNGAK